MDPVTQGLLGAVTCQALARKSESRRAALAGALAGTIADLDVLIRSAEDPLLFLEYHRHFTHTLAFIPLMAAAAAAVVWPLLRRRMSFRRIFLFALAAHTAHILLDACTSYGTPLLWPFSNRRIAWDIISIIDPVFTFCLFFFFLFVLTGGRRTTARAGLAFSLIYLGLGVAQRERAEGIMRELAQERGQDIARFRIMPSIGNIILWRCLYQTGEGLQADAVRTGFLSAPVIYRGPARPHFNPEQPAVLPADSTAARDLRRFQHFADGWLILMQKEPLTAGDARYSLLPHQMRPLWGVQADLRQPQRHVRHLHFQRGTDKEKRVFMDMLLGRPLPCRSD